MVATYRTANTLPRGSARAHTCMLSIDSRSRDSNAYADNDFVVDVGRLHNVVAIGVESAEVPNTLLDVGVTNNKFDIQVNGGAELRLSVAAGAYNATTLAAAVTAAIEAASPEATVTATANPQRNDVTFAVGSATNFSLLVNSGTNAAKGLWRTLGFDNNTDRTTVTTAVGNTTLQLKADEHYVLLRLDGFGSVSTSDNHDDIMAKLATDDISKFNRVHSVAKVFDRSSPLPSLGRLRVRLLRRDGTLYNLRSSPFSITLTIQYLG